MKTKIVETEKELNEEITKGLNGRATRVLHFGNRQIRISNKPLTSAERMRKIRKERGYS